MDLNKSFPFLLFSPTDAPAGPSGDLSISDMVDELGKEPESEKVDLLKDDTKKPKEKSEDPATEIIPEPSDDEETDEPDEEDEEEIEPEIDDLQPIEVISRKEILKAYPDLFKKFPQLETAYYREKKYAELLPTIEDAKEAVEKAQNYERFEKDALDGNISQVIAGVKTADPRAYNKMVDNYLPMLGKVDQQAYFHVIGNVIKNTIVGMVTESGKTENEDLKAAAVILHQFMFGNSEFKKAEAFGPHKPDEKENDLTREKQEFATQKFEASLESLATANTNAIKSTISQYIDPKGVMTDYVKRTAIKEAMDEVEETMNSDRRFKSVIDKLWEQVFKTNHSKAALDNVKKAHLNKAKTILRPIIQKHRNEALRGMGKRVDSEREEPVKKGPVSVGRSTTANNSSKETTVPKGMRTIDYLMQD